jgi:hypothetical protein
MGIFRYDSKYSAPTKEQRNRYMRGESEVHSFGKNGEILLVIYDEAAYLKDDTDGVRMLFTGVQDKQKVQDEVRRLLEEHDQKEQRPDEFRTGKNG